MNHHPDTTRPTGVLARGGPFAWRAIDLVTLAVLGVAFGVVFWGFSTFIYPLVEVFTQLFPPAGELMLGVWLLPAVLGALVVRRPGAALFIELVAASIEAILGNKWGGAVLISAVLQAGGVEFAVALYRWRRWKLDVAVLAGALAAVSEIVLYEWWTYVAEYSPLYKAAYLGCGVISGVVVAGILSWKAIQLLAATGVLHAFPAGEELLAAEATVEDDIPHP
ncbi:putative HMP/thiamine permease protein YkoE [Austwickia sp. TVS 96-490-7B]|uniref:ECF transporter S component n=1 Tax=Austwickia sp. TVS 96-490-7B TaxID=2830843 RepID=UPI001C55D037|nr:ECF transporter S component [Austwickia sp. TVS 96-490-7B]MBW3083970.1 putative HMP/thiamine permease protein YkoE [Austwickia sp. TVS 96-490-7B]